MYPGKVKNIKRVLLIQPWRDSRSTVFGEMEPYALMVLATAVKSAGCEVKILDLRIKKRSLQSVINSFKPDMVAITSIVIDYFMALEVAKVIKQKNPEIWTIVGGIHATLKPEDYYHNNIDLIVRGPGVEVLPSIIRTINENKNLNEIPGLIYKNQDNLFIENKDWKANINQKTINLVPDRNLLRHHRKYRCFGFNHAVLVTAQGCTGRCNFCACWPAMAGKYITKSPENVVQEIKDIIKKGQRHIFIGDDNTFEDVERAWEIVRLLDKYLKESGKRISLNGYCRADVIAENPDLFKSWAKVGLNYLTVGMESITDDELKKFNKHSSIEINEKANEILTDCGIVNLAHILIRPDFTKDDFKNIWEYIYKKGITNPIFPILTALPGTAIYANANQQELYPFFDLGHPIDKTVLPLSDYYKFLRWLVFKNYSYTRWILANTRNAINKGCKFIGINQSFELYKCRTPEFISIPFNRYLIRKESNRKHLLPFYNIMSGQ